MNEEIHQKQRDFKFRFESRRHVCTLAAPVDIPLNISISEMAGRLIHAHTLPEFVNDKLCQQLSEFIDQETKQHYYSEIEKCFQRVKKMDKELSKTLDAWSNAFTQECSDYSKQREPSDQVLFADTFHHVIHSPALTTLLNLEQEYANNVSKLIDHRNKELLSLQEKHNYDMERIVEGVGVTQTDSDVNELAVRHFEETEMTDTRWASELSSLQDMQRREFRDWVMTVYEDLQKMDPSQRTRQHAEAVSDAVIGDVCEETSFKHAESFTIHLGAQMKTMHNIRLLCADVMDLCKYKMNNSSGFTVASPQRLQTALSLYSSSLSGLILLVDNRINSFTGIKKEFANVCQQSTEFHFLDLEAQMNEIQDDIIRGNRLRNDTDSEKKDKDSLSTTSNSSTGSQRSNREECSSAHAKAGDFYVTRHSNLAEVHVVFHLVYDEAVYSTNMSSRQPVIIGLRNVLKMVAQYDIDVITVPLLLVHEMTEEMTINWCNKRAELVFKCVKGFMMELTSWGASESKTVQFVVPTSISDEAFQQFSTILPNIFRVSTPLVLS